jgi:hypothetical protein
MSSSSASSLTSVALGGAGVPVVPVVPGVPAVVLNNDYPPPLDDSGGTLTGQDFLDNYDLDAEGGDEYTLSQKMAHYCGGAIT